MRYIDIRAIAEENLDGLIAKSLQIEAKNADNRRHLRKSLRKAMTFDPMRPLDMGMSGRDSEHYCPYQLTGEGGYQPYSAEYWLSQIEVNSFKNRRDYREGYNHLREYFKSETAARSMLLEVTEQIIKAAKKDKKNAGKDLQLKAGAKHTHNGIEYERDEAGSWNPIQASGEKEHPVEAAAKEHHKKVTDTLDRRKSGDAKEPDFEKRKADADARAKELKQYEQELDQFEDELREREHQLRQGELDMREQDLNAGKTSEDAEGEGDGEDTEPGDPKISSSQEPEANPEAKSVGAEKPNSNPKPKPKKPDPVEFIGYD